MSRGLGDVYKRQLEDYRTWEEETTLVLARREREFLEASISAVEERERAEVERVAREQSMTRRARRNAWLLAAVVLIVAAAGAYLAWAATRPAGPSVVLVHGGNDNGIQQMILTGAREAGDSLPIEGSEAIVLGDIRGKLERIAADGPDLIVASVDYAYYFDEIAPEYPETHFIAVESVPVDEPNLTNIGFADGEVSFLMGVAAASVTKTGTVGYIGASQAPLTSDFAGAYHQGVASVDPTITVLTDYVSPAIVETGGGDWFWEGFFAPDLAYDAAINLFTLGADVVYTVAGTSGEGSIRAAADFSEQTGSKAWAIGVDVNEGFLADERYAPYVLTSMLKNYDVAIYEAIRAFTEGTADPEMLFNLANGGVGYSDYGTTIRTIAPVMDDAAQAIVDGTTELREWDAMPPAVAWRYEPDVVFDVTLTEAGCSLSPSSANVAPGETIALMIETTEESGGVFFVGLFPESDPSATEAMEPEVTLPLAIVPPSIFEFRLALPGEPIHAAIIACWPGDADLSVDPPSTTEPIAITTE